MDYTKIVMAALMSSMVAVSGCSGDDDEPVSITVNSGVSGGFGGSGGSGTSGTNCGPAGNPNGTITINDTNRTLCELDGRIEQDTTLGPTVDGEPVVWQLNNTRTFVGDGENPVDAGNAANANVLNVTLTIEAGTEFRSNGVGTLVITRGSKLNAQGTAQNPITMSSRDSGFAGRGEWGGLVLQGFAESNLCDSSATEFSPGSSCNIVGEGGVGSFGGTDNGDSSGTITYLRLAEGGVTVSPDNEINGISLQSVGSGTTMNHIQVHNNQDDGIEFFGGVANVKNIVLTDNADDSIDWDEGWRGAVQFGLVKHASDDRDHGIEADNAGDGNDDPPRSQPILANVTWYGSTAVSDGEAGHRLRRGTGGHIIQSVVSNYQQCMDVDSDASNSIIDTELSYRNVLLDCAADTVAESETSGGNDYATNVITSTTYTVFSTMSGTNASGGQVSGTVDTGNNFRWNTPGEATGFTMDLTGTNALASTENFIDTSIGYAGAADPNNPSSFDTSWVIPGSLQVQ